MFIVQKEWRQIWIFQLSEERTERTLSLDINHHCICLIFQVSHYEIEIF